MREALAKRACLAATCLVVAACAPIPTSFPPPDQVPPGRPLPIDGLWRLTSNDVVFRFDRGRVWSTTPYTAGVSRVQPDQVLVESLEQLSSQRFRGYDQLLKATWNARVKDDGSMEVTVATLPLPTKLQFEMVQLDDAAWFAAQLRSMSILPPPDDPEA